MNRNLSGMLLTAFAFCITISCSERSASDPMGLALNDSTAAESRVASASVTLAQSSLVVGQTTQATALLLDRYHNPLTLSVVWSSSDSAIATVSRSGRVTAKSPGTVSIVATRGYKSGAATLTVVPSPVTVASVTVDLAASSLTVGQTTRATATLRDSSNNVVTGPAVAWTSSNASTATLTDSGMVTALAPGSTVISASAEGRIGTAPLAVTLSSPIPVATVTVSPASASLRIGATVQLQVSAFDANNIPLTGRIVTSSSADPGIASVNSLGLVTAVSAGTTQITVTSEGKSAIATITVSAIAPPPAVNPGAVTDLQASGAGSTSVTFSFTQVNDGTGQPAKYDVRYAVAPISWGSATSTTSGTCTTPVAGTAIGSQLSCTVLGLAPATHYNFQLIAFRGTLNLNAVFGGLSNIVSATTTAAPPPPPVPVASVSVSPASSTLQIGATVQLLVTAFDANNNVLTGRIVTSSSANSGIASVNSLGLVTAVSAGTTQITVVSEGKSAVATITVTAAIPPPAVKPSTVTDLQALAIDSTSVTLSFTQVNDGTGQPAKYDVRYAVAPITWGSATSTTSGTCKTPVAGTAIGSQLSCTVLGLTPATNYNFQLIAFRGTLNLNAVFGSPSNIVAATTTGSAPPPPPPPPPGGSAEPPGMTVLTDRPFNAVSELGWGGAWDEGGGGGPANFSVVTDATAPKSPSSVGQMRFPVGLVGGYPPAVVGTSFSGSSRTLYVAMWVKLSTNWVGNAGAGGAKISHVWINGVNRLYTYVDGVSGPLSPWVNLQQLASSYDARPQGGQGSGASVNLSPNIAGQTGVKIIRGQWHKWEVVMYGGNAGSADGTVDWWIDGVKVGHYTGIPFVASGGSNTWDMIEWNPTWGGLGGSITAVQYQWMDHMYISGKP